MLDSEKFATLKNMMENVNINELIRHVPIQEPIDKRLPEAPTVKVLPNPIHETNRILEEQTEKIDELSKNLEMANSEIAKQTKELQSIHYENMKLNAQIDILNKTVDSQNGELERLRSINAELETTNKTLRDNSKHSTRNAILLAIGTGIVLIAIEHWYDIYTFILYLIK